MIKNMIALGERSVQGEYGSIRAAGSLTITDSQVRKVTCAGNIRLKKSNIIKLRCTGSIDMENTEVNCLKVAGAINVKGVCKGNIIAAKGRLAADYLECTILKNGLHRKYDKKIYNDPIWSGSIKAETFENHISMKLNFDYEFQNILSFAQIISEGEIACENFYSFHVVRAPEVNAENIFLLTTKDVSIGQLAGSRVTIKQEFRPNKLYKSLPKTIPNKKEQGGKNMLSITSIEADQVDIEYTNARRVSGQDVNIGDLCIIDRVEYKNTLQISEKSVVNEVVKV